MRLQDSQEKQNREIAVSLVGQGRSVRNVAEMCKMSKSTIGRFGKSIQENDKATLLKRLNPLDSPFRRRAVRRAEEAIEVNIRLLYALKPALLLTSEE